MCPACWRAPFFFFVISVYTFLFFLQVLLLSFLSSLSCFYRSRFCFSLVCAFGKGYGKRSGTRRVCDNFLMFHCLQLSSCPIAMSKLYYKFLMAAFAAFTSHESRRSCDFAVASPIDLHKNVHKYFPFYYDEK